jgi:Tol biopolymer transport system component
MSAMLCLLLMAARLLWDGPGASHLGSPSPNGRYLTGIDPDSGDLLLRDFTTQSTRRLTHKPPGSREFAYFSVFSRDSRSIAFAWFNAAGFYELRLLSLPAGEPRTLYRNPEAAFLQPTAFTTDGKHILTLLFRRDNISQIALIDTTTGVPKIIKSLNWVYPKRMDISPDSRWIVYDNFARDGVSQRDIFLLATDGARELKLVDSPADDVFPLFSPDGTRVFYSSDGSLLSLTLPFSTLPKGSVPLLRDIGRFLPLGFAGDRGLLYAVRKGGSEIYQLSDKLEAVGEGWSPAFSPNGARLAWLGRQPTENFGVDSRFVAIRHTETRTFLPALAHIEAVVWNEPNLLLSGSDGKGRGGLFSLNPDDGALRPIAFAHDAPYRGYPASGQYFAKQTQIFKGDSLVATLPQEITCLAVSPAGRIAACTAAGLFLDGKLIQPGAAFAAAWAGDSLFYSTPAGLWRRVRNEANLILKFAIPIESLTVHPDGNPILFSAGKARTEIWAVQP